MLSLPHTKQNPWIRTAGQWKTLSKQNIKACPATGVANERKCTWTGDHKNVISHKP